MNKQTSAWQPIETAPKDGTQFLFNAPELECNMSIGYFEKEVLLSAWNGRLVILAHQVTHWHPLPQIAEGIEI